MFVKIRRSGQRFWVEVFAVKGRWIAGYVDNRTEIPGYGYGDLVVFKAEDVIDIMY